VAAAAGGYAAFLLHAALDWDWEISAVTTAGLLCGSALLLAARGSERPRRLTTRGRAVALAAVVPVLGAVGFLHVGNVAGGASATTLERGDAAAAVSAARRELRWAPWSVEARQRLGEAQHLAADDAAARLSFGKAIALDPGNWALWYGLAEASTGSSRHAALAQAAKLNPLAPELTDR
jgi:tetratricopeptide (TPR) repeat protein